MGRFTDAELSKDRKRASFDTEDDAWAGYKPKFVKSPVNRVWKFNWQPVTPDIPKKTVTRRKSNSIRHDETKPVVATQPLQKGQSQW